jgi:hypothetical protein
METVWVTKYLIVPEKFIRRETFPMIPMPNDKAFRTMKAGRSGICFKVTVSYLQCSSNDTMDIIFAKGPKHADKIGKYEEIKNQITKWSSPGLSLRFLIVTIGTFKECRNDSGIIVSFSLLG